MGSWGQDSLFFDPSRPFYFIKLSLLGEDR